ncbi:MAG: magnesium transporter, partial [Oscillospiraceae bacterium]|nr:magnesium transporter [Oscillospiraceae bacterium]
GEVEFSDWLAVLWKELRVSLLCGIGLVVGLGVKLLIIDRFFIGPEVLVVDVALSIGAALFCTIICAKVFGSLLPILGKKAGLDPAVMASPLITTIIDILSLVIYFSWASALLNL